MNTLILPISETVTGHSGIDVSKQIITHGPPDTVVIDFEASLPWWSSAPQPHCQQGHPTKRFIYNTRS